VIPPLKAGPYEVRMARNSQEVQSAQALRYQVMYAEKGGRPDLQKVKAQADIDQWDELAHHIIVLDTREQKALGKSPRVVGTLRLTSNKTLTQGQRFYTEGAFDLTGLRTHYDYLLELGRFCIDPDGRNGVILMLIWKFAMEFIITEKVEVMFGCASFPGTDIHAHQAALSYLYQNNLAHSGLMPTPKVEHISLADIAVPDVDFEASTRGIPTLLRGYLKLGARVSDAAVIDPIFNTSFLCIYVDAAAMLAAAPTLVRSRRRAN